MRRYRKWALTLGIMAATPGIATAGPLSIFKPKPAAEASPTESAATKQSNQKIADDIGRALRAANLKGYDIEVEYKNGVAILTGKVTDPQHKIFATRAASSVRGVKRVDNQLQLVPQTAAVPAKMPQRRPSVQSAGYTIEERPHGTLRQVSAEVPAAPEAPADFQPAVAPPAGPSNQKVAQDIAGALSGARLSGYDIEIQFQNATALLAGTVSTPEQQALATKVASQVPGVQSVNNQLRLGGGRPGAGPAGPYAQAPGAMPFPVAPAAYQGGPGQPMPMSPEAAQGGAMSNAAYDMPQLPDYAWPSYASYPNYAQVAYPQQYSASAWPYIGPFYPYPQVPLGWRRVTLEWDDGAWNLKFNSRTDKWWWFLHPKNWH